MISPSCVEVCHAPLQCHSPRGRPLFALQGQGKKALRQSRWSSRLARTAEQFINRNDVVQTLLVIDPADEEMVRRRYGPNMAFMNVQIVHGGKERFESVANALAKLHADADFVAIHDAVRPCITEELITAVFARAAEVGAALLALPVSDTVKRVDDRGKVLNTMPRSGLWLAQTPQVFRRDWLESAYAGRGQLKQAITDDAQLIEAAGHPVVVVEGCRGTSKSRPRAICSWPTPS